MDELIKKALAEIKEEEEREQIDALKQKIYDRRKFWLVRLWRFLKTHKLAFVKK